MSKRARTSTTLPGSAAAAKWGEIAWGAGPVIAHRLTRLALAGPVPTARDQREFHTMVAEKPRAMAQAAQAMWAEALSQQWRLTTGWWQTMARSGPWWWWQAPGAMGQAWARAAEQVAKSGLKPVHQRVRSNSRRLARTPLR